MGIYIPGMEVPEMPEKLISGERIPFIDVRIFADGTAVTSKSESPYYTEYSVVEVPPHGRLGDLDALEGRFIPDEAYYPTEEDRRDYDNGKLSIRDFRGAIKSSPTVIEAEERMTFDETLNALRAKYPDTMNKVDKLLEEYKKAENEFVRRSDLLVAYDGQHKGKPGKARKIIAEMPAADVKTVVRGKWERVGNTDHFKCTCCNNMILATWDMPSELLNFCPHCGADMRKEVERR